MKAPRWDGALHKFFAKQMIAATHTRCGRLAAVYAEGDGWRWERRCRCDPSPALPEGDELAALVAKAAEAALAQSPTREWSSRAPLRIYV